MTVEAILEAGGDFQPLPPPKKRATYVPRLPGSRRHWLLPEGEVLDPHYDYGTGRFTGTLAGKPWTAPWKPDLAYHVASQIPGCCVEEQGKALFALAQQQANHGGVFVEIGSALGLSASWIGWGGRTGNENIRLFCIDTFHGAPRGAGFTWAESVLDEFKDNIRYAGLERHVVPVQSPSSDAVRNWDGQPVSLLYIDALHTYAACRNDHLAWTPYLRKGSIICFDDCIPAFPSIMRYQRELAEQGELELLGRSAAMLYWRVR